MLPNFLVIGAAKAGTTSLHSYLTQHPEIYMSSVKEPGYFMFADDGLTYEGPKDIEVLQNLGFDVTDLDVYQSLFRDTLDARAVGESTPFYLYSAKACQRIKYLIPDVKLIAILRSPMERAYSNYMHQVNWGRESLRTFDQALQAEEDRIAHNWHPVWHYKEQGFYFAQLKRYFDEFPRSQIRVYLYEDLNRNATALMQDIFQFLGVDDSFCSDVTVRHNSSDSAKKIADNVRHEALLQQFRRLKPMTARLMPDALQRLLGKGLGAIIRKNVSYTTPPFTAAVRSKLLSAYRDDILKLQELIQKDLADWLV